MLSLKSIPEAEPKANRYSFQRLSFWCWRFTVFLSLIHRESGTGLILALTCNYNNWVRSTSSAFAFFLITIWCNVMWGVIFCTIRSMVVGTWKNHPAGSSINSAFFEDFSKFWLRCLHGRLWEIFYIWAHPSNCVNQDFCHKLENVCSSIVRYEKLLENCWKCDIL